MARQCQSSADLANIRGPSDADSVLVQQLFSDEAIAELTFVIATIRAWNVLNASFHTPVPETPYVAL